MTNEELSEDEVARYWDQNAPSWSEQVRKGFDAHREYFNNPAFLQFIGELNGKTVLDAGCGEGYNTRILARKGARIVGIDISPKMIELARQQEQKEPLGIRYEVASFSELSLFDNQSFDTIVSFMAMMDGPEFEKACQEFFRVLRKNGAFYFSVTHPCFLTKGLNWIENEQGTVAQLTVSDYFSHEPWVEHWKFSQAPVPQDVDPFVVPYFPRTVSDYLNGLLDAGFAVKRIAEPRPTPGACKQHPWLQRWRDHAAMFLYVFAKKL